MTQTQSSEIGYSGPDLCAKEATEVVALLKAREVSPKELLDAAYARIAEVEPDVNAMPILCPERAYAAAEALDRSAADNPGWLAGLPIAIKDLNPVKGVRTTWGTKGLADFVPDQSDILVELLEARGGVVAGKTNTPEYGAGANTFNDIFGPTLNPYDLTLNPGGSSGGAAVSLATGEMWLSHGSDHGGSLRTPASFCGIVGLRPSPGRCGGASKDSGFIIEGVQGPMARSVRDCALFLDAMAGFDARNPLSYPAPDTPFQTAVAEAEGKLRIAFTSDLGGMAQIDREMEDHLRSVLTKLDANGAAVEEYCPDLPELERTYHTQRGMMWATMVRRKPEEITQHFKATLAQNTRFGQSLTIDDIADAQLNRSTIYQNMVAMFDRFDVLALPVTGCMPHPQAEEWVQEVGGETLTGYMDWLRFAFLATMCGLPAISVPTGFGPRGLPVGIQLIGKPRGEAGLLAAARFVEMVTGGPNPVLDPRPAGASTA